MFLTIPSKSLGDVRDWFPRRPAGCHQHDTEPAYACLTSARRDAKGRAPGDPDFDAKTMRCDLTSGPLSKLTATQLRWWEVKRKHADCVLFYKIGKFYELYHTDADVGVAEAGLVYMKGFQAHSGFPEMAYGKYMEALVSKGFKVARVEQTETPDETKVRVKAVKAKGRKPGKVEAGMRREICSLTTPGTRLYTVLDMRAEKDGGGFEEVKGATLLAAVLVRGSKVGACLCDCPTGSVELAEFEDDATYRPAERTSSGPTGSVASRAPSSGRCQSSSSNSNVVRVSSPL